MTTKYLTGAYPSGYYIQGGVDHLNITSTASIGGQGLFSGHALYIDNEGIVKAGGQVGLQLYQYGGVITNGMSNHSALIEGGQTGIHAGDATIDNYGTIIGLSTTQKLGVAGVAAERSGSTISITNGSANDTTALIKGSSGIFGGSSGSVTNFATIVGTVAYGVWNAATVVNGSAADGAALLQGATAGVFGDGCTLTNYGSVVGSQYGVEFRGGGTITNQATITASGSTGVGVALNGDSRVVNGGFGDLAAVVEGAKIGLYTEADGIGLATIVNYATIEATGAGGYGAVLHHGTLTNGEFNDRSARIEGAVGVSIANAEGLRLFNNGVIEGVASAGLLASDTGQDNVIVNGSGADRTARIMGVGTALIDGGEGDTVINYGTIDGLSMTGSGAVLEVAAGCSLGTNPVTIDGTLALISGTGTLSGLSNGVTVSGSMATTVFDGVQRLQVGRMGAPVRSNAQFTLTGTGVVTDLTVFGRLTVDHQLTVTGSGSGVVMGNGVVALAAHATVKFEQAVNESYPLTVSFLGSPSLLELTDPAQFGATIVGMVRHGRIDLVGIAADSAVLEAGDKLVVTDQGAAVATLQLAGNFGSKTFTATSDGAGGTFISVVRQGGADPPAAPPHPAALASAAAAMGTSHGGNAASTFHAGYATRLIASPRVQTA